MTDPTDPGTSRTPEPTTPPITRSAPPSGAAAPVPPRSGVGLGALIGVGIGVVLLSFVAAFLGASLAGANDAPPEATTVAETPAPVPTPRSSDEVADIIAEILPAGSAVRAGTGVPAEGKGYEGDLYIDVETADVYVFRDGAWVIAGNIRESAAENLTGEQGSQGEQGQEGAQGQQGETGGPGEPGAAGTQVLLGTGEPDPVTCEPDGDIYVDIDAREFYQCTAGEWAPVNS